MAAKPQIIYPNTRKGHLSFIRELPRIRTENRQLVRMCEVICDCGNIKTMRLTNFTLQSTYSCGCKHAELRTLNPFNPIEIKKQYEKTMAEIKLGRETDILNKVKNLEIILMYSDLTPKMYEVTLDEMFTLTKKL